jgi:hypothetical protein
MTYQDLIEELQALSPEELKQNVTIWYCCEDVKYDEQVSFEEIDELIAYNENNQLVILA